MKLASFDIFDTVLIRKCGKAENIFYLLAHRLYPNDIAKREDFLLWRLTAESNATHKCKGEVSIEDIYTDTNYKGYDEYTAQELVAQEKEIERENLTVNPKVKSLIHQKREAGYTICFISDMYLDSDFLTTILKSEGCLLDGEQLFVSCEQGVRKSTGALYRRVSKLLQPDVWEHYGDNGYSDIKVPRRLGIKAFHIESGFTDAEKSIIEESGAQNDSCALSLLAGLSRAARLSREASDEVAMAADFVAPTYVPYALFLLNTARKRGIKRLYFLSRDSYILMKAVQALSPCDIEIKYLFVSRQSLSLPYLSDATAERFLAITDHKTVYRKYVNPLLCKMGTHREELTKMGITFTYDKIETREQEQDFLQKIFHGNFVPVLRQRAQEARELLLAYFEQEGLFDGTEHAMIDIGWLGTSRLMINQILNESGHRETLFFYCGTRRDVLSSRWGEYISYFPAGQLNTELTALLENYFSASPYPTTIGYRRDEGHLVPIFPTAVSYTNTSIIQTNVIIAKQLITTIASLPFINEKVLYRWACLSLETIYALKVKMDLSPIARCAQFGEEAPARRLSFAELCVAIVIGKEITAMDRVSIYMTCGKWLSTPLLGWYKIVHCIKNTLFQKLIYQ